MQHLFRGLGVSLLTPFHRYGTIDFSSLEKIIENTITNGADFLLLLSPYAESASLSKSESLAVQDFILETVKDRIPLILCINANNTQETIDHIKELDLSNYEAILASSAFKHYKPKQKGIYNHFKEVSAASPLPLFILNTKQETGLQLTTDNMIKMFSDFSNIIGMIDMGGDIRFAMDVLSQKPAQMMYLPASEMINYLLMMLGAEGCVSLLANAFPQYLSGLVSHMAKGEYNTGRDLHFRLLPIMQMMESEFEIPVMKAMTDILGLCSNNLRLPLTKIKKSQLYKLQKLINEYHQVNLEV